MCACQKSYTLIIMTSITWAGPRCVQEAAAILGPQNRVQGRCEQFSKKFMSGEFDLMVSLAFMEILL